MLGGENDLPCEKGGPRNCTKSDPEMVPLWGGQMSENIRGTNGFGSFPAVWGNHFGLHFGVTFGVTFGTPIFQN